MTHSMMSRCVDAPYFAARLHVAWKLHPFLFGGLDFLPRLLALGDAHACVID